METSNHEQCLVHRQEKLQQWLDENGLTRRALAKWIGMDPSLITHVIKGSRKCTDKTRASLESVGFPMDLLPNTNPAKNRGPKKGGIANEMRL